MVLYAIILFLAAVPMTGISIAIFRGNTGLILDYHQTKVADKAAYGKAFGKAMLVISLSLLLSGIIGLLGDSAIIIRIAVTVLFLGLIIGIGAMIAVQKEYNKGIF